MKPLIQFVFPINDYSSLISPRALVYRHGGGRGDDGTQPLMVLKGAEPVHALAEDAVTVSFTAPVVVTETPASSCPLLQGRPEEIAADPSQYQALGVRNVNLPGFEIGDPFTHLDTLLENHRRSSGGEFFRRRHG